MASKYTNHLINETSPYLLQHAHNPVDWYPWGDEAIEEARRFDKPIFLSIGYSTCHWCHVMERESFEDEEIAALMNKAFVNVKVDREELPHIDSLYMEFAQHMLPGSAGWPLNVILTPALQPFFAVTYLPPLPMSGMMGMKEMVEKVQEMWHSGNRLQVVEHARRICEILEENSVTRGEMIAPEGHLRLSMEMLFRLADPIFGGIGQAPKFPFSYQTSLLLRASHLRGESRALWLAERTLEMMARGGIYDHLGGAFCRYAVDEEWLVPHFEKTLYDNALLAVAYTEAWHFCGGDDHRRIACEVLDYLLRDLRHPDGPFYSAEDADSEGEEGRFYLWTIEEVTELLGPADAALFVRAYGMTEEGNFEGRNILHLVEDRSQGAAGAGMAIPDYEATLERCRRTLFEKRNTRERPFRDEKVVTAWNGFAIAAFVSAARAFEKDEYLRAALAAAEFVYDTLWKEGRLLRSWCDGEAAHPAVLDDYAAMISASLALFEAGAGTRWLMWATEMTAVLSRHFQAEEGAFYQTEEGEKNLLLRRCQYPDGAEPSGNALHCENLLKLYSITANSEHLVQAECILKAITRYLESYPIGYCYHLVNILRYYDQTATAVVAATATPEEQGALRAAIDQHYHPHRCVIPYVVGDEKLKTLLPSLEALDVQEGTPIAMVCHKGACEAPIQGLDAIKSFFDRENNTKES